VNENTGEGVGNKDRVLKVCIVSVYMY